MTLAALALVYLNPWVTMLLVRSASSSGIKIITILNTEKIHQFDLRVKRESGAVTGPLAGNSLFLKNS